jgi:hypothetical protein
VAFWNGDQANPDIWIRSGGGDAHLVVPSGVLAVSLANDGSALTALVDGSILLKPL